MANLSEAFPNTNSFENPKVKNYFNSQDNLFMRPQQPVNNVVNEILTPTLINFSDFILIPISHNI